VAARLTGPAPQPVTYHHRPGSSAVTLPGWSRAATGAVTFGFRGPAPPPFRRAAAGGPPTPPGRSRTNRPAPARRSAHAPARGTA